MPPARWMAEIDACSVPLNFAEVPFTTGEMVLVVVPSLWTSRNTADPWNPELPPTVVAQVGLLLVEPLVGFRLTAPGWLPTAACATPVPRTMPPAVAPSTPSTSAARLNLPARTDSRVFA